ncbi:MAG: TonB family protein / TonB-dependent receptor [Myxococcaceae bacterium]|nr:TonB family protein / TonB-dependent receptor [Myxococcaceae bacterium]
MTLPGFLGFASFGVGSVGARSVPVIASVVLHASLAAGLVATVAGHSRAGAASPTAEMTVDVETLDTRAIVEPQPIVPPVPETQVANNDALPTHTHPYPVDPSHDAHPHDPSLHHDEASPSPPDHDRDHDHDDHAEPAAAAPALVATGAALPKFDLSSGSGAPTGVHVATSGTGSGAGVGSGASATSAADDVVHAASTVQVAARLVQSMVAAYPVLARADEVEGDVGVEIVVDREGRVVDAHVTRAAGHGFDEAALTAVRAYRFSPAQREGRAVRVRMPWSVQFRLR